MRQVSERIKQMVLDREAGMTCKAIAEKYGVSHQRVQAVTSRYHPSYFRHVTETGCIYPNLRRWMNDNKIGKTELLRRMGLEVHPQNCTNLSNVMRGKSSPKKPYIDRLLRATGFTYENLFYTEGGNG